MIFVLSLAVWALAGAGYFWPKWVILWGAVAMSFRAIRAMRDGPPEDPDAAELSETALPLRWPQSRSALGWVEERRQPTSPARPT